MSIYPSTTIQTLYNNLSFRPRMSHDVDPSLCQGFAPEPVVKEESLFRLHGEACPCVMCSCCTNVDDVEADAFVETVWLE
mmetsp:Transcript_37059/g.68417  ORF Transcript_37059/g.68417 Transcript_37059/m.68417 type:complete len:80 (+) Transcript_37059:581-820(+)